MKHSSNLRRRVLSASLLGALAFASTGCLSHAVRVEPITIAPVQVTMDVNLHVDDERPESAEAAPSDESTSGAEAETTEPSDPPLASAE